MAEDLPKVDFNPEQTFSCSNCGFCCSNFDVAVSSAEIKAVEKKRYPGVNPKKVECFKPLKDDFSIIVKDENRKCVFMDEEGLCVIHKYEGTKVKPLACRLFPFTVHHWVDGHISADLRYICPAVGMPDSDNISGQVSHIRDMAEILKHREKPADATYSRNNPVGLEQIRFVHRGYRAILEAEKFPVATRLLTLARVIDFHAKKSMYLAIKAADEVFEQDALEFLNKISEVVTEELKMAENLPVKSRIEFRNLLMGFIRDDMAVPGKGPDTGIRTRLHNAWHTLRFGLGGGSLKQLNPTCPDTAGNDCFVLARTMTATEEAMNAYLQFLKGKMDSMHFCGRYIHHLTYEQGLRQLLATAPAAFALAGLFAAGSGSMVTGFPHMRNALTYIETAFGISPYFKLEMSKRRVGQLASGKNYAGLLKLFLPNQ